MQHAGLQLSVYNSPVIMFDIATMQVMAGERNLEVGRKSERNFVRAQKAAVAAWLQGRKYEGKCALGGRTVTLNSQEAPPEGHVSLHLVDYSNVLEHSSSSSSTAVGTGAYGGSVTTTWEDGTTNQTTMTYTEGKAFIAEFKSVELWGRDGK